MPQFNFSLDIYLYLIHSSFLLMIIFYLSLCIIFYLLLCIHHCFKIVYVHEDSFQRCNLYSVRSRLSVSSSISSLLLLFSYFCFGVLSSGNQALLLTLCTEIIPCRLREPLCDNRIEPRVQFYQFLFGYTITHQFCVFFLPSLPPFFPSLLFQRLELI